MKKIIENEKLAKVVGGDVTLPAEALEHIPDVALENGPFRIIKDPGGGR